MGADDDPALDRGRRCAQGGRGRRDLHPRQRGAGPAAVDAGLIDQYNLLVFPVLLGAGKSLFGRADRDKHMLALRESESYSNGILKLVYDVKR
jgi:hypothetical protein